MQAEEAVEVERAIGACRRAWECDGGAQLVVALLTERHHHVQTVDGATLENRHQNFLAALRLSFGGVDGSR